MFGMPTREGKCKRRNERGSLRIVLGMQLAAVGFDNSANAIKTKTIMTLADVPERFAPPILCS